MALDQEHKHWHGRQDEERVEIDPEVTLVAVEAL